MFDTLVKKVHRYVLLQCFCGSQKRELLTFHPVNWAATIHFKSTTQQLLRLRLRYTELANVSGLIHSNETCQRTSSRGRYVSVPVSLWGREWRSEPNRIGSLAGNVMASAASVCLTLLPLPRDSAHFTSRSSFHVDLIRQHLGRFWRGYKSRQSKADAL